MENENRNHSRRGVSSAAVVGRIVKYFGGWLLAGLLAAIAALMLFGWLADEVFEGDTKNFDDGVRNYIHQFASPALTSAMKFFSFVGSPLFLGTLGVSAIIAFVVLKWKRALSLFLITMAGEIALSITLKAFFKRAPGGVF